MPVVAVAETVTDVGEFPDVKVACATPLAFVVAVLGIVAAALLRLKATTTPGTGLFDPSLTVAVTSELLVELLFVGMVVGLAERVILPTPVAGVMETVTRPVRVDAVAVTVTDAAELPAVRVAEATPVASVTAVGLDNVAAVLFKVKLTVVPDIALPELSFTVADMVVVPLVVTDVGLAARVIVPPATPPVMLIEILPVLPSEVAVTFTVPLAVDDAVKVTCPSPFEVKTLELERLPLVGSSRVKAIAVPFTTGFPVPSTTRVVIVDVPETGIAFGLAIILSADVDEADIDIETDPVKPPEVAVMLTFPVLLAAVKLTFADPPVVVAVPLERVPFVASLREKVTEVPSATRVPVASLTVAVTLARP